MIGGADLASRFALDVQGVGQLKLEAKQSSPEALRAAAQQFEAVFMNMLMKSMREATPHDGMFDSEQTRMYTSMLDQQLTQKLASRGIGLADMMVRQLSRTPDAAGGGATPDGTAAPGGLPLNAPQAGMRVQAPQDGIPLQSTPQRAVRSGDMSAAGAGPLGAQARAESVPPHVETFVRKLLPHAQAASAASGIPASFMMGQAALETGWGRSEIRGADGRNSHNLFGIKAGGSWKGRTVDIVTTEYVAGQPQKQVDRFRAYDSYADAFRDYAALLRSDARYRNAIAQGQDAAGFAQGLQEAGYATDPGYAQKLVGTIRLVETT
ncbi:MAG: flagellar assembly peptidoglycan hydrolase FlgJ [Betaproteobacteria bacterium]|nr:flagellar assembly peptidoglycan hydrolase FlgJ [Betaproteobacteria bacterium]